MDGKHEYRCEGTRGPTLAIGRTSTVFSANPLRTLKVLLISNDIRRLA